MFKFIGALGMFLISASLMSIFIDDLHYKIWGLNAIMIDIGSICIGIVIGHLADK